MTENAALAAVAITYLVTATTGGVIKATLSYRAQKRRDEARKAASHAS